MTDNKQLIVARAKSRLGQFATQFRREEDGVMVVFTLFILVLMLIVGGMAVDFMRFESRRSLLQGIADNAVLAAADLDQTLEPSSVVDDYFSKAPIQGDIQVTTVVGGNENYRTVATTAQLELDTFFLRLIGMDTLGAVAKSTAIEGVGNIEVSLVVDISGSMDDPILNAAGNPTGETKIAKLRAASTTFVNTLLTDETRDRVSLSFVPYSAHVSIGPEIYDRLNTIDLHERSHCVDLPVSAYNTTEFDTSQTYQQAQHWQWNDAFDNNGNRIPLVEEPECPMWEFEDIIPLTQNVGDLTGAIAQLEPRGGTAIFMGLKWGVALLDPTTRGLVSGLADPVFAGRPVDYPTLNDPNGTLKYVVLMTDGKNFEARRLRDWAYQTPSQRAHWANMNYLYFFHNDSGYLDTSVYTEFKYDAETADGYMQSICGAAKAKGIIIYGIAMDADAHGEDEMEECASSPSHYYETSGDELEEIFEAIAEQITDLRLTQ